MTIAPRDIFFILANAIIGVAIGFLLRAGVLSHDAAIPPLMLIFVGMAAIELIAGQILKIPLGQLVGMPVRIATLIVAFAASMLVTQF